MPPPHLSIFLAPLLLYSIPALADSDCTYLSLSTYNATGSTSFAGLQPPELGVNASWTLNTAVLEDNTPPTASMHQTFYITTSPFINLTSTSVPLTGCAFALQMAGTPSSNAAGTCDGVLTSDCQQALITQFTDLSFGNSGSGPSTNETCSQFLNNITTPSECSSSNEVWSYASSSATLGNTDCSSATSQDDQLPLFDTVSSPFTPSDSNTTYDTWLKQATPVIITAWLKNGSGPESWADTRIVCVQAGDVVKGSVVPNTAERGRSRVTGWAMVVLGTALGFATYL